MSHNAGVSLDPDWITFLKWALPQLRMRWAGFRKVRGQVQKRVNGRLQALDLAGPWAYRDYLRQHPGEWLVLDTLCHITISRFYRDQGVYALLAGQIMPDLAQQATRDRQAQLRIWSAGCASGEEPYSLSILWTLQLEQRFPDVTLTILASDVDRHLLGRARKACYPCSSLRDLPPAWRDAAFTESAGDYCLQTAFMRPVLLVEHDVRTPAPATSLHLILCRNLVYTYYERDLQLEITTRLHAALRPGGVLVLGSHETLPVGVTGFTPLPDRHWIYTKALTRSH
jgi:chemotaxis protein methyltransferase CheR